MIKKVALALGTFDGVHKGHIEVLRAAEGCDSAVALTFLTPPAMEGGERELLTTPQKKQKLLKELGFSVETLVFSQVRDMSPQDFLLQINKKYSPARICCGFNYRFGRGGKGDTAMLWDFCKEHGIELCVVPAVECDGERVSSTLIREKVKNGDIEGANRLLGRQFSLAGEIVHGDSRGRTMGIPTVNFFYPRDIVTARHGVYAAHCSIDGTVYPTVTYIGNRPTYHIDRCIVETNILSFTGDLYGKTLEIRLDRFLREDIKFDSKDALKAQIEKDIIEAKKTQL